MTDKGKQLTKTRDLTPAETSRIMAYQQAKQAAPPWFEFEKDDNGNEIIKPHLKDGLSFDDALSESKARLYEATGLTDSTSAIELLNYATVASRGDTHEPSKETVSSINSIAAEMAQFQPRDAIEGHLVAQIVSFNRAGLDWMCRARKTDRVDFANSYANIASKFMTRHHQALEQLRKYRTGGEQRVHVEYVHVHQGGQAIVGNVGQGGGIPGKVER
jgi:hypothetical protein